jgi:hypothetical protein
MGKLVTVKSSYQFVLLPNKNGDGTYRNYSSGDQVTLTDAEYAALPQSVLNAITLTTSGLPDPKRKATDPKAGDWNSAAFTAAGGGTISLGTNFVTGPAGGVTYTTGWLTVPADSPSTNVVGPKPGSVSIVHLYHKQGATASVAPTGKNWFAGATTLWPGGTVPTFTASANALDLFRFESYDGGSTWVNVMTVKGLA